MTTDRIRAALRLLNDQDITPTGRRRIERVLDNIDERAQGPANEEARRVWLIMAGGRRGRLHAGPYGSEESGRRAYESLLSVLTEDDDGWGPPLRLDQAQEIWTLEEYDMLETPDLGTSGR